MRNLIHNHGKIRREKIAHFQNGGTFVVLVTCISLTFACPCGCSDPNCGCLGGGPCSISGPSGQVSTLLLGPIITESYNNGQAETEQANWEAGTNEFLNSPQGCMSGEGTSTIVVGDSSPQGGLSSGYRSPATGGITVAYNKPLSGDTLS